MSSRWCTTLQPPSGSLSSKRNSLKEQNERFLVSKNIQKSTEIHGFNKTGDYTDTGEMVVGGVKYPNCPNLVYSPFLPLFGIMIPNDSYFSGLSEAWPEQRRRTAAAIRLGTCAGRCHGCHRHLSIVFLLDFRGDLLLRLCDLC